MMNTVAAHLGAVCGAALSIQICQVRLKPACIFPTPPSSSSTSSYMAAGREPAQATESRADRGRQRFGAKCGSAQASVRESGPARGGRGGAGDET